MSSPSASTRASSTKALEGGEPVEISLRRALAPERVVETRAAWVFLTADRAFKLKKRIRNRHFDHREVESRLATCKAEVEVNRPLAPGIYLGVRPVTRRSDGTIGLDLAGVTVDWVIEMTRLPDDALLDRMIDAGTPIPWARLDSLADRLFAFYRANSASRDTYGTYLTTLRRELHLSERHLEPWEEMIERDGAGMCREADMLLDKVSSEITARETQGLVVDGHGDLRPEHVCLIDPPVIFDRIEFSPTLRLTDVYDEIGYLGLEAKVIGDRTIGPHLLSKLAVDGFLPPSPDLMAAFRVMRCLVRARLCIDHLLDERPRMPEVWPIKTRRYLDLAWVALGQVDSS